MAEQLTRFKNECREVSEGFISFCKTEKGLRWFTAIWILILWGIRIVNDDIFFDSEIMELEPYALLHSWYGSRRFGLIFTKRLFHIIRLVPYLSNLLFAITLWGVLLLLCYCLSNWFFGSKQEQQKSSWCLYLTAALFVSAPSLAEQYAYTLQAFEITLAMGFCVAAAFCAGQAIYKEGSVFWYPVSLLFLVWCLGSYQAFNVFYMALILISFLGFYEQRGGEKAFRCGLRQVVLFVIGFLLYLIIGEVLRRWKGADSSYVDAMFLWGKVSNAECLNYIKDEFRILYCGAAPALYNRFAGIIIAVSVLLVAARGMIKGFKNRFWYLFAVLLLAFSPLIVSVLTGMRTPIRGQLAFPLVFTFFAVALWHMVCGWIGMKRRIACYGLAGVFFYLSWIQGMNLVQLNQTLHDTVKHDMLTAERMYTDICRVADRDDMQNCRIVFVGTRDARIPASATRGEVIGHSFFDFGITDIGVTNRVTGLLNVLGMNTGGALPADYTAAVEASRGRASWPAAESVFQLDDFIVVKLSD